MIWKSSRLALVVVASCALGALGAFGCNYHEEGTHAAEKTSVGRDNHAGGGWLVNDGGIGGGPAPTVDPPNASGSAVAGDDMTKENPNAGSGVDVPGHGRGSVGPASSSSASMPGGIESQGTSMHNGPHTNGPVQQSGGVIVDTRRK